MRLSISRWIFFREHRNDAPCDPWDYEPDERVALVAAQCRLQKARQKVKVLEKEVKRLEAKL